MSNDLFRKKALERYLRIDAPGALLTITPPLTVVVFGAMAALFVALLLLGTFGRAQMAAEGRGIVRADQPAIVLRAPFNGTVLSVARAVHDDGKAGDVVLTMDARAETQAHDRCVAEVATERAELSLLEKRLAEWNASTARDHDASTALVLLSQIRNQRDKATASATRCDALGTVVTASTIAFPVDASIEDIAVTAGGNVHAGDALVTLTPSSAHLVGYLALGERYRSEITTNQRVRVKFDALPYDEVGAGSARVVRIADALPSGVKIEGAPSTGVFAQLSLDAMPAGSGPPRSGMTFTADVLTRRRQVLALVFGGTGDDP